MAINNRTYIEVSKIEWKNRALLSETDGDAILKGCMQRIATATEKMANNYDDLLRDRDWYRRRYNEQKEEIEKLHKRLAAQKAATTRVKNKYAKREKML